MQSSSEIQKIKDAARLEYLNRQLLSMEKMLQKADDYNDTLAVQINKLKDILRSNQKVFSKLQINQQGMRQIFKDDGQNEQINSKLNEQLAHIENKLYVTVSLFNDFKYQVIDMSLAHDEDAKSQLGNQLNQLGINLISAGNQLKLIRQDKTAKEQEANNLHHWSCNGSNQTNMCWTQCKTQMQDMLQMSQLTVLQRTEPLSFESDIQETPIRQIRCQKKIIQRVESILAKAENSNIRSETLRNVKVLAKMVLSTLIQRKHHSQLGCMEDTMSNNAFSTSRAVPDNLSYNPYL